jgi:RimJ/RimL family protein N-acetyltransferase
VKRTNVYNGWLAAPLILPVHQRLMRKILETNRLILRELTRNDADDLFEFFGDPEAMKYLPGTTKSRNEIEEWLSLVFQSYQNMHFGPWAIILKESNEFLGYCGLTLQKNVDGKDEVEILYGLIRQYWGMGYATEAAIGVYKYGKTELKLSRFIALVEPGNLRSSNVVKKVCMKLEKETRRWGRQYHKYSID